MVLALGPVGCGFQPIYARSGGEASSPMAAQLESVRVAAIPDRMGQMLRNNLVNTLSPRGEPASPAYVLAVDINETNHGLATSKDGNATVGEIAMRAHYRLTDARTGKTVYAGSTRAISNYRYLGPRYASTVSQRESETDALIEVAAEIRGALSAYFNSPKTFDARQRQEPTPVLQPLRSAEPFEESQ